MSVFSGSPGRGAMRLNRRAKRFAAFNRGLAIWNDGTGFIDRNPQKPGQLDNYKRVANPLCYLEKSDLTADFQNKYPQLFVRQENGS